jgi:hypothetical protein
VDEFLARWYSEYKQKPKIIIEDLAKWRKTNQRRTLGEH